MRTLARPIVRSLTRRPVSRCPPAKWPLIGLISARLSPAPRDPFRSEVSVRRRTAAQRRDLLPLHDFDELPVTRFRRCQPAPLPVRALPPPELVRRAPPPPRELVKSSGRVSTPPTL
ncbi:hypothetical protein EVAR_36986_1 [Eumeta japonica]|uniref:Uncharacterized protein n=1 Tax=Eumeta variegata TaxID=151549 RepID=A0A4C1X1B1_EUMVA|nr:hypothetical protein EVAR_36986_1 [Eumeta japonica]